MSSGSSELYDVEIVNDNSLPGANAANNLPCSGDMSDTGINNEPLECVTLTLVIAQLSKQQMSEYAE